ncbi:MAG: hypothetical protein AB1486_26950 [Planctomycetota bacterium]
MARRVLLSVTVLGFLVLLVGSLLRASATSTQPGAPVLPPAPPPLSIDVGSDGSDGIFDPSASTQVDLSLARNLDPDLGENWENTPGDGHGVYDPVVWAVVFKYQSITVSAGKTITFVNHPSRAPVVWLSQGDVSIAGTIDVRGGIWLPAPGYAQPGPGGFRGGRGRGPSGGGCSGGFGPGGAPKPTYWVTGSHATPGARTEAGGVGPTYGNEGILPLIGGSGGSLTETSTYGGGGGGGAILIASNTTISLSGTMNADACSNLSTVTGAGGAVRLVADTVTVGVNAKAYARAYQAGASGQGRIRIEGNTRNIDPGAIFNPPYSEGPPSVPVQVFPSDTAPRITASFVDGQSVPADPRAGFRYDSVPADMELLDAGSKLVVIEARYVPLDWEVRVRVGNVQGEAHWYVCPALSGTLELSTTSVNVDISQGVSALQVRAAPPEDWPPVW